MLIRFSILVFITFFLSSCASHKAKHPYQVVEDLEYGSHERHRGDLYLAKVKAPIVFTVHGGGWDGRDRSDMKNIAESLASHGINVFNINYRLAPEFKYPSPVNDLELAVEYVRKNYGEQIDENKVGLWGYSAGAQIVMLYGLKGRKSIAGIVTGGGPYDFTWWPESPLITPYMGYKRDQNIQGWLEASPISHLRKDSPPLFLYHAKKDQLVEHSQMTSFEARALLKGVSVETHSVDFWGHAFTFVFSDESVKKGVEFLKKNLL